MSFDTFFKTEDYRTAFRKCDHCGESGVKLWRNPNCFGVVNVACFTCSIYDVKNSDFVRRSVANFIAGTSCQLCYRVPYVTSPDGVYIYGLTSIPEAEAALWKSLPLYEVDPCGC